MKTSINKSLILNRIKDAKKFTTDTDLACFLGINKSTLSNWYKRNSIDFDLLFSKCESMDLNWLLTGENYHPNYHLSDNAIAVENKVGRRATFDTRKGIPLIPIEAMIDQEAIFEYDYERFVIPIFGGAEFLIRISGDSMQPKYNSGDIVACKYLPIQDIFFQWNKVYVLNTKQGPLIKRVSKSSSPNTILIVSDNGHYESFELPINQINAIAIVIGLIRPE